MKIAIQNTINNYSTTKFKTLNQAKNVQKSNINLPALECDSVSFGKKLNQKNKKRIGASLASALLASSLFLGACSPSAKNNNISEEIYLTGENKVNNAWFSNSHIVGSLNRTTYDIEESKIYDLDILHPKRKYSGRFGDDEVNYTIRIENIFENSSISGNIGDEPMDLKVETTGLWSKVLNGEYKGQKIFLEINRNLFGYTINGNQTDLTLDCQFGSFNNFSIEGGFEYDKELLPVIFSYMKFVNDIEIQNSKRNS